MRNRLLGRSSQTSRARQLFVSGSIAAGVLALAPALAHAQATTQVRPYFLVIVDTSGSMNAETGSGTNSCGYDRTRANDAKCVLRRLASSVGEITFGLARFHVDSCTNTARASGCATSGGHGEYGSCSSPCGGSGACNNTCWNETTARGTERQFDAADIIVPIGDESANEVLFWTDHTCNFPTNPELDVSNWTPIGGSLGTAFRYYANELAGGVAGRHAPAPSPIVGDPYSGCRPYRVILLTDGDETCGGAGAARATELRTLQVGGAGPVYDVRTYVIGFGISPGDADIEAYATAGGTDAPGANRGFYATDEASLSLAFSQIISESVLVEVCDNVDNNCNGVVDEGFQKYCDRDGRVGLPTSASTLCTDPGDDCDMSDDNCFMGTTDEPRNLCGTCGTVTEICNRIDDDCDGSVDEGGVCDACPVFEPESCDGIDNDCDGCIDGTRPMPGAACVSLTRECGGAIGICTPGTETCVDGEWVGCTGVTPRPEECNNLDDDCDGIVDGFSEDCGMSDVGVCQFGVRLCTAGVLGECIGEIGPSEEICDGLDNDCDGETDEGNPGGGAECGGGMGACSIGTLVCLDGALVCMGGVSPEPEVCDGDDNDCNGIIDDGIASAGPCGTDEGACMVGMLECIGGTFACIGATEPAPEICNCVDDDCDGEIDEEAAGESLCPTGRCVACQCAQPCAEDEFPCSVGRRCVDNNNEECSPPRAADCVCVGDPCATVDCPDTNDDGDRIVCQAGVCVPICDTVSCGGTQVCRNTDGRCVDNSCRFLPCDTGRYCDESTGMCQADLCAAGGVMCTGGEVCNPATGMCTADDLCDGVMCAPDHFCRNGDCFPGGTDAGPPPPPRDMGTGGRTDGGGVNPSGQERGLASGGGGLICAAPGALGSGDGSLAGLAALLLLGLALVTRRIRGKSPSPPRGEGRGEGVAR